MESRHSVIISKAILEDAESITSIQAITWLATYPNAELSISEESIRKRIEGTNGERIASRIEKWRSIIASSGSKTGQTYIARINDKVVGFGSARITEANQRMIGALYVLPEAQGRGVGRKLMQKVLGWLGSNQDIYVTVASYNHKAIKFYKSFGFRVTDRPVEDTAAQVSGDIEIPEIEMVLNS